MKVEELIGHLEKVKKEYGNINVCTYSPCHEMPCESIVPEFHDDEEYVNFCEDNILKGDFILLR